MIEIESDIDRQQIFCKYRSPAWNSGGSSSFTRKWVELQIIHLHKNRDPIDVGAISVVTAMRASSIGFLYQLVHFDFSRVIYPDFRRRSSS